MCSLPHLASILAVTGWCWQPAQGGCRQKVCKQCAGRDKFTRNMVGGGAGSAGGGGGGASSASAPVTGARSVCGCGTVWLRTGTHMLITTQGPSCLTLPDAITARMCVACITPAEHWML
jgi:hypothetical protein